PDAGHGLPPRRVEDSVPDAAGTADRPVLRHYLAGDPRDRAAVDAHANLGADCGAASDGRFDRAVLPRSRGTGQGQSAPAPHARPGDFLRPRVPPDPSPRRPAGALAGPRGRGWGAPWRPARVGAPAGAPGVRREADPPRDG